MKLTCKKCGTVIAIPTELRSSGDPRVACPGCQTSYRLRRQDQHHSQQHHSQQQHSQQQHSQRPRRAANPTGPSTANPTGSPSRPGTPVDALSQALSEVDQPTQQLVRHTTGTPASPSGPSSSPSTGTPGPAGTGPPATPSQWTPTSGSLPGKGPGGVAFHAGAVLSDRYRILRFLARGGMGEVYEAEDLELRQRVALKTISPSALGSGDGATLERFKREIALARVVTHPNVCRIFDLGTHIEPSSLNPAGQRTTFLTMELLEGETLSALLRRRGRLPISEALPLTRQMAAALDAAHRAQIVHRDFKSENVFLVGSGEGMRVVVTDFGVARGNEATDQFAAQVTGTAIVGTPAYMAPEQVEGGTITPAADIYALGIVLYEVVTGSLPFQGPNPLSTAVKRLKEPPPPPTVHAPDVPVLWEKVILRCLERPPARRFSTAGQVAEALETDTPRGTTIGWHGTSTGLAAGAPPPGTTTTLGAPGAASSPATPSMAGSATPPSGATAPQRPRSPATGGSIAVARSAPSQRSRGLMITLVVVALLSVALLIYNQRHKETRRVVPRRAMAVYGFENLSERPDSEWLATALAEMMVTELSRGGTLRTIPSDTVRRARQELGLMASGDLPVAELQRFRSLAGADYVLSGSYTKTSPEGGELRLDVRLHDAARGATVASFDHQGTQDDLFAMVAALGNEVRGALGIDATGDEDPLAGLPSDPEAARLYAQALDDLRALQPHSARQALQEALAREPENPLLHAALSSAWDAEGYAQQAASAARRAFELSSILPQEDRLVIEGRFREAEGNWLAAAEVYTALWDYFPDDLDYGLRLVAAENNARRPLQALRAIDRLRQLPAPLSEDPRIDLAEANAAAQLAEPDRQLQAARRAAGRATALGASLLSAQARLSESQALLRLGELQPAADAARQALDLYTETDNPKGRALAVGTLANALLAQGDLEAAAGHYQEAIDIHRWSGNQVGTALGLNNLALVHKRQGHLERAQALYEEAEAIYRETGSDLGLANTANNLGVLLVEREQLAAAGERFEKAREVWEASGNPASLAFVLNNIAEVRRLQGRLFDSRDLHRRALELRKETGQKLALVTSSTNLARVSYQLGEVAEAKTLLGEALTLAEQIGEPVSRAEALQLAGELARQEDRLADAEDTLDKALVQREDLGLERPAAETRLLVARVALAADDPGRAESLAHQALETFRAAGRRGDEALAQTVLARSLLASGRLEEARGAARQALALGVESERRGVSLEAEIVALRVEGGAASVDRLRELELQLDEVGDTVLRLEATLARAEIQSGSTEGAQVASRLEAEATALGFLRLARRAKTTVPQ